VKCESHQTKLILADWEFQGLDSLSSKCHFDLFWSTHLGF
jgi:hypothetical protein